MLVVIATENEENVPIVVFVVRHGWSGDQHHRRQRRQHRQQNHLSHQVTLFLFPFIFSRVFRDSSLSRTAESSSSDGSSRPVVDRFPFCHAGCRRLLVPGRTSAMCTNTFCAKTYENALSVP